MPLLWRPNAAGFLTPTKSGQGMVLGTLGAYNSNDPMLTVSRSMTIGSTDGHAFSDSSHFDRNGFSYNSFDARINMGSVGHTLSHYAAFQTIPELWGGSLTTYYGVFSQPCLISGSTIGTAYHFCVAPSGGTNNVDGLGTVGSHIGLYMPVMTGTTGQNYLAQCLDPNAILDHAGSHFIGAGGAISFGAGGLNIGHNIWYDPARGDFYPRTVNDYYALIQPHSPGDNVLLFMTGQTPASLSSPISDKHISMEMSLGTCKIGDLGVWLYGSKTNFLQFGGTTSAQPALKVSGTGLVCRLADDSSNASFTVSTLTATGAISGSNLSGTNTGDQSLTPYALLAGAAFAGAVSIASGTLITNASALSITQTWNASGTTFDAPVLVNVTNTASAATSRILDLKVGSTSKFAVDALGTTYVNLTSGNSNFFSLTDSTGTGFISGGSQFAYQPAGSASIQFYMMFSGQFWANGSLCCGNSQAASNLRISTPSNGVATLTNRTANDFTQLQFGGTTSSFPSLKKSSTTLQSRLADDSGFCPVQGKLTTDTTATTGLSAGALSATTNASIVLYDASGQAYRVPCII